MQLPPTSQPNPPISEADQGPAGYEWDEDYPGTLKPGKEPDNYPLEEVMASEVYELMEYQELDIDERDPHIFPPDDDFLEWLAREGKLLPRGASEAEFDTEADKQISGITEDDLDFADDDSKMIAYYSRQGEGSAAGTSNDFGGMADSVADT